jgi:hypothetical protein
MIDQANKACEYLERVVPVIADEVNTLGTTTDLDVSCQTFADVRALKERAEGILKSINAIEKYMQDDLIPLQMDATHTVSPYNHAVGQFKKTTRVSASIIKDVKDEAWSWLRRNKLGSLIIETVNAQTLGATARSMLEKGQELPSNLFTTSTHTYVAFTPPKKEK